VPARVLAPAKLRRIGALACDTVFERERVSALAHVAVAERVDGANEPIPPEDLEPYAIRPRRRRDEHERPCRIGHCVRDGVIGRVEQHHVQTLERRPALRVARDAALGGRLCDDVARDEHECERRDPDRAHERRRGVRSVNSGDDHARETRLRRA
jgi:hypothetical protein